MRKTVWYLVQDLTTGTQFECKGQKKLLECLKNLKCSVDNNALTQITQKPISDADMRDENVGELYLLSDDDHDICVEEMA